MVKQLCENAMLHRKLHNRQDRITKGVSEALHLVDDTDTKEKYDVHVSGSYIVWTTDKLISKIKKFTCKRF